MAKVSSEIHSATVSVTHLQFLFDPAEAGFELLDGVRHTPHCPGAGGVDKVNAPAARDRLPPGAGVR